MNMGLGGYCFDVDAFAQDGFDVARFLEECRTRSPMETIHQDLRAFQTVLENQLVAIINQDYAEFLQLSSRLKGVDEAVASVRAPLLAVLKRVDLVESVIQALATRVHGTLRQEEELRRNEAELELSIRVSDKLLLLEQLLEITSFEDDVVEDDTPLTSPRRGAAVDGYNGDDAEDVDDDDGFDNFELVKRSQRDGNAEEACAMLERATQLLIRLDLEFLDGVDIPYVQREEKRIAVIEDTLLRRLETEFATEVFPDTFYNRDHAISAPRLSYLLRSYVMLQKSHIPEDMIARLLVQPFADENITRGRLDGRVRGSCEGLQQVYNDVLEFVNSKFGALLQLPVCQGERKASVDLLGNAIWKPLFEVISTKHAVVFKSSDANRFHHNYTISVKFLAALEDLCGTEQMKQRFRSHESVVEFKEKWNMDVYFQLRSNELSAQLDASFGSKRPEKSEDDAAATPPNKDAKLLFPCSQTLWDVMKKCWDKSVYLPPLLPQYTKLCLQLVLHFIEIWQEPLEQAVAQLQGPSKANFATIQFTCLASEEDVLCAGNDFNLLYTKIKSELLPLVSLHTQGFVDDSDEFAQELYEETLAAIALLEERCWEAAASTVAEECKRVLPAIRTVKGQYQMTNKPAPTAPSTFVPNIARPLEEFLERWGCHFVGDAKQDFILSIVGPVCELYHSLSGELLKSAQELEDSLKSRKMQRNAPSGLGIGSDGMSDTQKMREQLRLDLDEFHRIVANLGVKLSASPAFVACRDSLVGEN